jgi:uncharacterized protein YfaP (DUF2135 family)
VALCAPPGALALVAAESEKIGKDAPVRDHAADDGHQHEERAHAHDPACPLHRQVMQVEMQAIEELAAPRITYPRQRWPVAALIRCS